MNVAQTYKMELWDYTLIGHKQHNESLDRLKAAYEREYAEWGRGKNWLCKGYEERIKDLEAENAELKAQVPKVVRLYKDCYCECGAIVKNDGVYENFCWSCGARLDWLTSVTCDHNCPKCKLWWGGWDCPEIEIIINKEEEK